MAVDSVEIEQLTKLLNNFGLLINNIADFGLLGLGNDYITQLESFNTKLADYGFDTVAQPIQEFIRGYNTKDYSSMAKQLFYLANWHSLITKKIHILNLKLDLKDESILEGAKESVELLAEENVTFVPLTITITKAESIAKSKSYALSLQWVGVILPDNTSDQVVLSSFSDKCITTFKIDSLYLFYDRLKSDFFINQLVLYNQLINSPITFNKIGTKLITHEEENFKPYIELESTINSKTFFSVSGSMDQLQGLIKKIPEATIINFNRKCLIEFEKAKDYFTIKDDTKNYFIHFENKFLLRQLYILHYTGVSVDLMLLECSLYQQFAKENHKQLKDQQVSNKTYHIVTVMQGGENIVIALQQFNLALNYKFVFDKLVLKFTEELTDFESCATYIFYYLNCQIPKTHPKIKANLELVQQYLSNLLQNMQELGELLNNDKKFVFLTLLLEKLELLQDKRTYSLLLGLILNKNKKDINLDQFKVLLIALAFLVQEGVKQKYIASDIQKNLYTFVSYFKMKTGSLESLLVQYITNQDITLYQDPSIKLLKNLFSKMKIKDNLTEDEQLTVLTVKKLFVKMINIPVFQKKAIELNIIWNIINQSNTLLDPILFNHFH